MLQGGLRETRYRREEGCDELNTMCVKDYSRKDEADGVMCAYIDDSIALHKVENSSESEVAVSLHLYSPPPAFCSCWDDHTSVRNFLESASLDNSIQGLVRNCKPHRILLMRLRLMRQRHNNKGPPISRTITVIVVLVSIKSSVFLPD